MSVLSNEAKKYLNQILDEIPDSGDRTSSIEKRLQKIKYTLIFKQEDNENLRKHNRALLQDLLKMQETETKK